MPIKGNKGEWSEFYAFIKILTDGKVFNADKNLEILKDNFYLVLKIIRQEASGVKSYDISKGDGKILVYGEKGEKIVSVDLDKIKSKVIDIFGEMKSSAGTTFGITMAEDVMGELHCSQIKASSREKVDLTIVLHDKKSPEFPELGFSIKSMLGAPSTLLNASGATNFVYKVIEKKSEKKEGAAPDKNFKVREAAVQVYGDGGKLEFLGMDSEVFRRNLRRIDSYFPEIIAEVVKHYYSSGRSKLPDLVDCIMADKEFVGKIDFTKEDLVLKIKRFLSAIALGMTPGEDWDGYTETHGGYIIVKENGEIACYHLYNRDKFEDYLFNNVKLDTPSTTRHKFGTPYKEKDEKRVRYNLQIRFLR